MYVRASNDESLCHHADQHDGCLHRPHLLGVVINLIHAIDPTKEKAAPKKEAPAPAPAPAAPAPEPVSADGVSPEVIAVIAAALASYGYGPAAIRAVRPIERDGWKNAGRSFGVQRTLE